MQKGHKVQNIEKLIVFNIYTCIWGFLIDTTDQFNTVEQNISLNKKFYILAVPKQRVKNWM